MSVSTFPQEALSWLGRLPAGWQVKPLKHVVRVNPEALSDSTDPDWRMTYADISSVSLGQGIVDAEELSFADAPSRARRLVRPGDTLVSTVRTYLRAITVVREPPENLVASTGFAVLRPGSDIDPNFLGYFATSDAFVNAVVAQSVGVSYPATNASDIVRLPIAFPGIEQQQRIAAFLDRKTAEIDTLIAKKRRLLDRLAERRTALITRAVTKGLDPDAPMKDSGIEWLGEIPAHWEVQPVYTRYSVQLGKMLDERRISGDSLVRYLRNVDVQWDKINYDGLPEMDIGEAEYERYLVQEGDLLVCEGGEIGRSAIVGKLSGLTAYQKALHRLRPIQEAEHPRYMFYTLFGAAKNGVLSVGGVSTISHLTAEQLRRFRFPTPPGSEQRRIANFLDRSLVELDVTCTRAEVAIDRLYEYRSALITNAVTGQIKVA